ncbi:hypothetical protein [Isoptericola croceus]|uniref:hypothetical protein n=1 Tax=Isoptericola croceus TaxID=3031406 RepID=UPI0023F89C64|nr:hypothetical protein [Isoptericola croceus]
MPPAPVFTGLAGTADGLAVDRDHLAPVDHTGAGRRPDAQQTVEKVGVQRGEQPTERRLIRSPD